MTDFLKLEKVLPKSPKKWKISEVSKWLEFVGLSHIIKTFEEYKEII